MSKKGTNKSGSRYSGYYMLDRLLPRSLCGGHLLVLCI
jgi:hypothetical protein